MLRLVPANSRISPLAGATLDDCFTELGQGCNAMLARARMEDEIARMERLGDGALAAIGIPRAEIARFVFRRHFRG